MRWSPPPKPEPVLSIPRVTRVVGYWDKVSLVLNDDRWVELKYTYAERLDAALPDQQQHVVVTLWGLLLIWPDIPYRVTLRRLLMDAQAARSPWGDPPVVS